MLVVPASAAAQRPNHSNPTGRSACHAQNPNDQAPSSGFFACWIALLSSIRYMQLTVQSMKTFELPMELPHKAILGASLVVVIQSIFDGPFDAYAYACAVGLISFFFAMILLLEVGKKWAKFIYFFLTGLWFCAVAIFTFQYTDKKELGVFSSAGNGFFATWIAFVSSFLLLFTELFGVGEHDIESAESEALIDDETTTTTTTATNATTTTDSGAITGSAAKDPESLTADTV